MDERQRVEHRRRASCAEVQRSLDEGIPAGVVVIEAWSDESTFVAFRDARYAVHPDGAPHRLADFTFPADGAWPDPKGLVDWLHAHGVKVLLWQIPLVKARQPAASQARADRDTMVARGYAVQRGGRPALPQPRLVVPGGAAARLDQPARRARWWLAKRRYLVEEVGVDGFKTDGGRARLGRRPALRRRHAAAIRPTTATRSRTRPPTTTCCAARGRDGVTFSRAGFTGAAGRAGALGGRRGLDLGGLPRIGHGRPHRGRVRHLLLGLGPGRVLGRDPRRRAVPAVRGDGHLLPDHAVPLGVQPPPARRRATGRPGTSRSGPGTRRCCPRTGASRGCGRRSCPYLVAEARRSRGAARAR